MWVQYKLEDTDAGCIMLQVAFKIVRGELPRGYLRMQNVGDEEGPRIDRTVPTITRGAFCGGIISGPVWIIVHDSFGTHDSSGRNEFISNQIASRQGSRRALQVSASEQRVLPLSTCLHTRALSSVASRKRATLEAVIVAGEKSVKR